MRKYSPGGVGFYENGEAKADGDVEYWPRERILDRYEQHVKHCRACSVRLGLKVHMRMDRVQFGVLVLCSCQASSARVCVTLGGLQGALRNTELGVAASVVVGALAAANAARLAVVSQTLLSVQGLASVAVAALAAFCWYKLRQLLTRFGFADYVHAERD